MLTTQTNNVKMYNLTIICYEYQLFIQYADYW